MLIFVKVEWQNFTGRKCLFFSLDSVYWKRKRKRKNVKDRKNKKLGWKLPKKIREKIKMRRGVGYKGR